MNLRNDEKLYQVFIVSWDAVYENVVSIASQLEAASVNYLVLNSGTEVVDRERWVNIGDVRFYNQFHEAIIRFDSSKYDYFLFILGDAYFYDWKYFIDRCNFIFRNINVGAYAPHYDNSPWGVDQTKLDVLEVDTNLIVSTQTDGIVIALHPDIVGGSQNLFNRLVDKNLIPKMRGGWGLDYVWCVLSMLAGKLVLRDNSLRMKHPHGSSYDHGLAGEEMKILLDEFLETVDKTKAGDTIYRIQQRMGGKNFAYHDFYSGVPKYKDEALFPPYHVITVSEKRRAHVEAIHRVMSNKSYSLAVSSLNAYNDESREAFLSAYPLKVEHYINTGELGCFGSHFNFWKFVVEHKLENAIVFEDDAVLNPDFLQFVPLALREVPKDYDVFSIFVHRNQHERFGQRHIVSLVTATGYQDWSTLCYMISLQGAKKLIEMAETNGVNEPVDWFIFRNGHRGLLNVYTFRPHIPTLLSIDTNAVPSIKR